MYHLLRFTVAAVACGTISAALLATSAVPASAASVTEVEANNSIATAQNIDGFFTLDADPNIDNSTTVPHATVNGTGNGTVDYYSFTVPRAGSATVGIFDIDGAMFSFDSWLTLYNSSGTVLAQNDDSWPVDPGSRHPYDSFLQFRFPAAGTYYIAVGRFPWLQPIPSGASYQLHVSVPNHLGGVPYLLDELEALVRSYNLPQATRGPLLFKVTGARNSLERQRLADVCDRMADFDRRVNELTVRRSRSPQRTKPGRLTGAQAKQLRAASARIQNMLNCA